MVNKIRKILRQIFNILYPQRCPVCDGIVEEPGESICLDCLGRLSYLLPPWCMKCGKRVEKGEELCPACREREHRFLRGRVLYEYDSVAPAIYRLKYGGRREYAKFFGCQLGEYLGDYLREIQPDALIPIPLHRARKRTRGYNQAQILARVLGEYTGISVETKILYREKNTRPQKNLNYAERQNNLKKAFIIKPNDVKLKRVVLVDDIYTTGTTIDEAATALIEAGVTEVYFIALACGA